MTTLTTRNPLPEYGARAVHRGTLVDIASSWHKSKVIGPEARAVFGSIVTTSEGPVDFTPEQVTNAFLQAFAGCVSRKGQSMARRADVDGLWRLWERYAPTEPALRSKIEKMTDETPRLRKLIAAGAAESTFVMTLLDSNQRKLVDAWSAGFRAGQAVG
jgi:hypothetical protein